MKHVWAFCLLLAGLLASGCGEGWGEGWGDDRIWDFLNYSVAFSVTDAATGADLLDPESADHILDQPITVHYGNAEYTLLKYSEEERPETRYNMPRPLGLRLTRQLLGHEGPVPVPGPWILTFGEFSPERGYRGEEFTIDWGDGTTTEVTFDCYIVWKGPQKPKVVRRIRFDGAEQESWLLELTR